MLIYMAFFFCPWKTIGGKAGNDSFELSKSRVLYFPMGAVEGIEE